MQRYQIIDEEEKVIHEGTEHEMSVAYMVMMWTKKTLNNMYQESRLSELEEKYPKAGKVKMIPYVVQQTTAASQPKEEDVKAGDRRPDEGHRPNDDGEGGDLERDQGLQGVVEQGGE